MTRYNAPSSIGLVFARMFGELTAEYIARNESDSSVYILAVRAFHNARLALGD